MKKLLVYFLTITSISFSQTESYPCKTDEIHQEIFEKYPQYNSGIINAHNRLQEDTRIFLEQGITKSDAAYVIPVVFHVIHNYGPENINDDQIHDALKQVNLQFRKLNPDTNEIVAQFKPIAADIEIEFRLAQLDPDGNCTSGITRTVSSLTSPGNHDVKSLIHWPSDRYLNVYICSQAAGLAGHALLPSAADTIPEWDGIVMQHAYVGTIGTSEYFRRTVLTHEIGHYLNLQHIWGGNNVPNYYYLPVAQAGNCAFDDEVADTPNTIGWQSCNLNGTTCGDLDNVQNYMDYAYCGRMFTEGQKARMHACLNSSVANRNNLWQQANLIATGTDDGTYYLCAAKFKSDKSVVCVGDTVSFSDLSYHGIMSRNWNFHGGNATSTIDSLTKVTYSSPGKYDVTLVVERNGEEKSITLTDFITVLPNESSPNFNQETFEFQEGKYVIISNDAPLNWELNSTIGNNSNQSIYINNFNINSNVVSDFYLYPVDVSELSTAVISFDVAYAKKSTSNSDLLQVYISTDCGQTWLLRRSFSGMTALNTTSPKDENFIPLSNEWENEHVNLLTNQLVDDLLVRFSFKSGGGNNIYIDNIQVAHPDQLSTMKISDNQLQIFPNPSSHFVTIHSENEIIEEVEVFDIAGKNVVSDFSVSSNKHQIDVSTFQSGTYLIRVLTNKGSYQHIQVVN